MASAILSEYSTRSRRIQKSLIVWVDADARSNALNTQDTLSYLRTTVNDVILIDQPDECLRILQRTPSKK